MGRRGGLNRKEGGKTRTEGKESGKEKKKKKKKKMGGWVAEECPGPLSNG